MSEMLERPNKMTLRTRTNLARKLQPTNCFSKSGKSSWGMRTIGDKTKNVQVYIHKSKNITTIGREKFSHGLYLCEVLRVNKFNKLEKYFGPHLLEYAIASIMAEAKKNKKHIIFYTDLKSVALKKKIVDVSMIEIKAGKERIWGVVYNEN